MTSFNEYLSHGNAWLFIPAAIVLGALHGLEPGHSKTMMAAFIVAIRGTVKQAVLLGVSATISHTAIIWILAIVGLHYAGRFDAEQSEPYFQLATGVLVIAMAIWMLYRVRKAQRSAEHHHDHGAHGGVMLDTGHGFVEISVFETNVPPHFRLYRFDKNKRPLPLPKSATVSIETVRPDGERQTFEFVSEEDFLQSTMDIPEPHEFRVVLKMAHGDHAHTYQTEFVEDHHHHAHGAGGEESQDEHERQHAEELQKRVAGGHVTTGQVILFGLTGGLLPCPSAFAVLLICLQLKKFVLGFAIVLAFSLGLAITLVSVGAVAALSVHHATKHFKGFGELARKAPYVSSAVMILIGLFIAVQGLRAIMH